MRRTLERYPATIALVGIVILVIVGIVSVATEANACWSNDGAMVTGLSWNGYICVDKNE